MLCAVATPSDPLGGNDEGSNGLVRSVGAFRVSISQCGATRANLVAPLPRSAVIVVGNEQPHGLMGTVSTDEEPPLLNPIVGTLRRIILVLPQSWTARIYQDLARVPTMGAINVVVSDTNLTGDTTSSGKGPFHTSGRCSGAGAPCYVMR